MSLRRTFASTGTYGSIASAIEFFRVGAWCVTEPMSKLSCGRHARKHRGFRLGLSANGAVRLLGLSASGLAITAARSQRESPAHIMRQRSWIAELGTAGLPQWAGPKADAPNGS